MKSERLCASAAGARDVAGSPEDRSLVNNSKPANCAVMLPSIFFQQLPEKHADS